nr:MAG TPA: hypothetical protein [Caudoviricetes sp.]
MHPRTRRRAFLNLISYIVIYSVQFSTIQFLITRKTLQTSYIESLG